MWKFKAQTSQTFVEEIIIQLFVKTLSEVPTCFLVSCNHPIPPQSLLTYLPFNLLLILKEIFLWYLANISLINYPQATAVLPTFLVLLPTCPLTSPSKSTGIHTNPACCGSGLSSQICIQSIWNISISIS